MRMLVMLGAMVIAGCATGSPGSDRMAPLASVRPSSMAPPPVRSSAMGRNKWMVSCLESPNYCTREATTLCGGAFMVLSNVTDPADYGRMTMVVRCDY